ncbi:hypothetical protein LY76DRAFT_154514 [Colletotrichum caudatum]|nr:hypothetical protein LY76DRAFT_154514 [Colletotrichum caudatum]
MQSGCYGVAISPPSYFSFWLIVGPAGTRFKLQVQWTASPRTLTTIQFPTHWNRPLILGTRNGVLRILAGILRCEWWAGTPYETPQFLSPAFIVFRILGYPIYSSPVAQRRSRPPSSSRTFGPGSFLGSSLQDIHLATLIVGSFPNPVAVMPDFTSSWPSQFPAARTGPG